MLQPDEPPKHYAKWKKPTQKTTSHMIIFTWNVQKGKYRKTERRIVFALGCGEKCVTTCRHRISLCGDGHVLKLDCGYSCTDSKCV